jgi:cell division protein FtsB
MNKLTALIFVLISIQYIFASPIFETQEDNRPNRERRLAIRRGYEDFRYQLLLSQYEILNNSFQQLQHQNVLLRTKNIQLQNKNVELSNQNTELHQQVARLEHKIDLLLEENNIVQPVFHDENGEPGN